MIKRHALAATAFAFLACGSETPDPAVRTPPPVNALEVRSESLATAVPIPGSVEAERRAVLSTRFMARITSLPVEVGHRVARGQTVIRLGTDDVEVSRIKAEAAVTAATASRDEAARQAARMDTLLAQDAVPRVQRDAAQLALAQAESQLTTALAVRREVQAASRYATITSPFDGAVVSRHVNVGDLATPGAPLLVVEADGPREAVFAVPVDLAAQLTPGTAVTVTRRDRTSEAIVRAVAAGADPSTRTVQVRATLPADWSTGVAVTAFVPAGARVGLAIPERFVVRRGQLTGVRVLTDAGVLLRWVRLGRRVGMESPSPETGAAEPLIEVLSGLNSGDRIVP